MTPDSPPAWPDAKMQGYLSRNRSRDTRNIGLFIQLLDGASYAQVAANMKVDAEVVIRTINNTLRNIMDVVRCCGYEQEYVDFTTRVKSLIVFRKYKNSWLDRIAVYGQFWQNYERARTLQ